MSITDKLRQAMKSEYSTDGEDDPELDDATKDRYRREAKRKGLNR